MSDPRRLLEDAHELSDAERRALGAARDVRPPSDFSGGAWSALASKLPIGGVGSAGGAGAAANGAGAASSLAAGTAGTVKALVLGVTLGAAVLGGREVWIATTAPASSPASSAAIVSPTSSPPAAVAPKPESKDPAAAPLALPSPSEPLAPFEPKVQPSLRPSPPTNDNTETPRNGAASTAPIGDTPRADLSRPSSAPNGAAPLTAADAREESRLVSSAREALLSGAASQALGLLEQARRQFPSGTLIQEREALTIEGLARSGQRAVAAERARAFVRDYPGSPHSARVQAVLSAP